MSRHHHDEPHDDFGGLQRDLIATGAAMDRRGMLRLAARFGLGAGALQLIGCGASATSPSSTSTTNTNGGACSKIPEETQGPFPGDGSNGPNVLNQSGVVRSDIRSSFAGASGSAEGATLTVKITLVDVNGGCAKLAGYAVYLWHCDRDGLYSLYTAPTENYLRGVQETDADGTVTFTTTFPGCYPGRWPHIHFEIYPSLAAATSSGSKIATSQLALPADVCGDVYTAADYAASATNLTQVSLSSDMVFSDGFAQQLAVVSGSAAAGYTATLEVAVAV